jgi:hypothetical protein
MDNIPKPYIQQQVKTLVECVNNVLSLINEINTDNISPMDLFSKRRYFITSVLYLLKDIDIEAFIITELICDDFKKLINFVNNLSKIDSRNLAKDRDTVNKLITEFQIITKPVLAKYSTPNQENLAFWKNIILQSNKYYPLNHAVYNVKETDNG